MPRAGRRSRPNVLLILTDEQRHDHVGFAGNPTVRTPNLDRLAGQSRLFRNAYVANPICMPNRGSIFTGRMPSAHGVRVNGIPLDRRANTFPRELRAAGYRTATFGKLHLQNLGELRNLRDEYMAGEPEGDALPRTPDDDFYTLEFHERHRREKVAIPPDFYGFDEVQLTTGHGDRCSGHYYQWLLEQGVDPATIQGKAAALPHDTPMPTVWRTRCPEELYPTTWITDRTVEFIEKAKDDDAPFFAVCSYPDPHAPFTPPGRWFDMYDPADMPLPATFWDPHERSMPLFRFLAEHRGVQPITMIALMATEAQYRDMAARQYGAISLIDHGVGRVLEALERTCQAEDTVVIFTSDHGDMFGDHGLIYKGLMHYQACIRVALTIRAAGVVPGETQSLASSLDLARTILELTGTEGYYGLQGESLVPVLDDPAASVRDAVLIEEEQMMTHPDTGRPVNMRTLVDREARLTLYGDPRFGELFDLKTDPDELHNLYGDPAAAGLQAAMTERLAQALITHVAHDEKPEYVA